MIEVHQFPCLSDNYGFLVHDPASGETACIDTPDADAYLREAAAKGWRITQIWNTHWHPDHAGGNEAIKEETGCLITAPEVDAPKIPDADRTVLGGDSLPEKKPSPAPLLAAAKAVGIAPSAAVLVGDSDQDYAAAKAAGWPFVWARYGYRQQLVEAPAALVSIGAFDELLALFGA